MSSWEDKVANPDALGEAERKTWSEIEPLLNDLLDELKANGKIETVYAPAEMESLGSVLKKLDNFSFAHNALVGLFKNPGPKPFLDATSKFGFNAENVSSMYIEAEITMEILSTELFKVLLLFHMKDVSFAVSKFNLTMNSEAPISWPKLAPYVDSDFRNSLSHGTYSITTKKAVLYKDAKLFPPTDARAEMSLGEFMMRVKSQSVLYHCLFHLLAQKRASGFFTP
jgi:hypothetical protein